jgi:hypothetical protein
MNIDERLEAIAQSVELLAGMQKETENQMNRLAIQMDRLSKVSSGLANRNVRLETLVVDIAEGTARLLRAVEAHEQRIADLEGNQRQ